MIASSCSLPTVAAAVAVVVLAGVAFAVLTARHGRRTVAHHEQTLGVLRDLVVMYDGPFSAQGPAAEAMWDRARVLTDVPRRHDVLRVVGDEERNG